MHAGVEGSDSSGLSDLHRSDQTSPPTIPGIADDAASWPWSAAYPAQPLQSTELLQPPEELPPQQIEASVLSQVPSSWHDFLRSSGTAQRGPPQLERAVTPSSAVLEPLGSQEQQDTRQSRKRERNRRAMALYRSRQRVRKTKEKYMKFNESH